jgi:pilus assembly protein CpaB
MKPKTMMLMVVAVGCGLAASYMTSRLLAERSQQPAPETKITVLVAKQKVPAWVLIKDPEKYFLEKEVPESAVPRKALKSFAEVKDQRLSKPLNEEEYVIQDNLLNKEQQGLSFSMPPGTRAIAVKVTAESQVAGFIMPGSHVDIVSTLRGGPTDAVSKIIMQNMLVLAVDSNPQRDPNQPSMLGNTVTLAAKPEEATRLALASAVGELRLILRRPDEDKRANVRPAKYADIDRPVRDANGAEETIVQDQAPAPPPVPKLPALPPETPAPTPVVQKQPEPEGPPAVTHTMTIISGEYVQKAVFVMDPDKKEWTNGGLGRGEGAPRPTPQPQAQPAAPAAPAPAPAEKDKTPKAPSK